ncbi:MAG: hypothetical protein R2824_27970 [Saprospiraceae bacterium]|nr:hypothetical protein [Lewinella sp.]
MPQEPLATSFHSSDEMRFAVIDIGTNTFHLLIAEAGELDKPLKEIYRSRHFIKLGEKGLDTLSAEALQRGMKTLHDFRHYIDRHDIAEERTIALGTAALRTATNGPAFRTEVKEKVNIDIQIISGDREAQLIAQGALMAIPAPEEPVLIMDIGGGSVEFIIADRHRVYWAQSFPVGVAVLFRGFHRNDPILPEEITAVQAFLEAQLQPLWESLQQYPIQHLVGAAGTFDVIAAQLGDEVDHLTYSPINIGQFDAFYREILHTTQEQRYAMPQIPDDRADMIVVALILVDLILRRAGIRELTVSFYAMKEGMMYELLKKSRDQ